MEGWVFDYEADNLYLQSKTVWYGRFKSLDGSRTLSIYPFRETVEIIKSKVFEWVNSFPDNCLVVAHNQLGFDLWLQWRHFGIVPRVGKKGKDWLGEKPVQFVDTYVLSQYLNPDEKSHSLENLAEGSSNEKMDFRQKLIDNGLMDKSAPKGYEFTFWSDIMQQYCDDDVEANMGVFFQLWDKAKSLYGDSWIHSSFRQLQKDYWLYSAQAYTGAPFHLERANKLIATAEQEMDKLRQDVEPFLPPRPLKAAEESYYKIPAKPFKKNGEFSATFDKWLEKHNATVCKVDDAYVISAYGEEVPLVAGNILPVKLPLEIDDNTELKQYFLDNGWKPHEDFWNFKKGDDGKPLRVNGKMVKTTPKIAHQGKICPNLLKIDGDIPKKVVKFLSYRNRLGVVKGWVSNWRMEFDQRLSAEISGYTPTFRVKHKTLTNCPKAAPEVLLGSEMRDLFYAPKGYWYIGTDAAALENRTVASYTTKYDEGKFADLVLNGDSHSFNAFAFFPHLHDLFDIADNTLKDNPKLNMDMKKESFPYVFEYMNDMSKGCE